MEHTSATIRPAIWRTILSSRDWPSDGSPMISRRRRMMMRSAGSEGLILGVSPPLFAISARPPLPAYPASLAIPPRAAPGWRPHARSPQQPVGYRFPQKRETMKSVFAQLVQAMQRAHRQLGIGRIDQHANLDLGCGDRQNIDTFFG